MVAAAVQSKILPRCGGRQRLGHADAEGAYSRLRSALAALWSIGVVVKLEVRTVIVIVRERAWTAPDKADRGMICPLPFGSALQSPQRHTPELVQDSN
jgi:hypothetical protein